MDSPSLSVSSTERTADRVTSLTAKGEAHLENSQFADALDCFELALSLDSQHRQALLGRNRVYCQIIPRWHFEMLNDEQRNAAFEQALRNAITPDTVVLDIGSGTGLLAMMAARAGAKQTFTCEMVPALAELARETVERNGLADRIVTLGKKSMSLVVGKQMMRKANLLVTETVDCGLLGEGIVPSIAHAKANLLTEDAQIVPCGATVYAMVVESPRLRNLNSARTAAGFDVSLINQYAVAHYFPVRLGAFEYTPLTDPFEVFHFDFANGAIVPERKTITVRTKRDGVGQCVVFWFNMRLDKETSISNEPGSTTHWEQALQCLDTEVALRAGETMAIEAEHDCLIITFNSCKAG
jgi:Ribosomal protein L11 methyltransferase (PrmA)